MPDLLRTDFLASLASSLFSARSFQDIKTRSLALMRDALEAEGCIFILSEGSNPHARVVHHFGDTRSSLHAISRFRLSYFAQDPIMGALHAMAVRQEFGAVNMEQLPDPAAFRASEVYRMLYEPHGIRQSVSGIVSPMHDTAAIVVFYRSEIERPFTADALAMVAALMPLIGETLRRISYRQALAGRLDSDPVQSDLTIQVDDRLPSPGQGAEHAHRPLFTQTLVLDEEVELGRDRVGLLSLREREMAHLASKGLTNAQIAARTRISRKTVEIHISSVLRKLELNNRTELAYLVHALNASGLSLRADIRSGAPSQASQIIERGPTAGRERRHVRP